MLACHTLVKTFAARSGRIVGLDGVSFEVGRGEFLAIHGPSGSGKSTLLLTLGGMLRPSSGSLTLLGRDPYALSPSDRTRLRSESIGFVFQLFHLVPYLDVRQNILAGLPQKDPAEAERADALISELGLESRATELPGTLSAGERQRVALARALVKRPALILADEPTGNLDPENSARVFQRLAAYRQAGGTVIVVTHGLDAAPHASRVLRLESGRIVPQPPSAHVL